MHALLGKGQEALCSVLTVPPCVRGCRSWFQEVEGMAERIITMRASLRDSLEQLGSPLPWQHITDQIGARAGWGPSVWIASMHTAARRSAVLWRAHGYLYCCCAGMFCFSGISPEQVMRSATCRMLTPCCAALGPFPCIAWPHKGGRQG
jgi:hypothetical protein